jgi:hypothetical protein
MKAVKIGITQTQTILPTIKQLEKNHEKHRTINHLEKRTVSNCFRT